MRAMLVTRLNTETSNFLTKFLELDQGVVATDESFHVFRSYLFPRTFIPTLCRNLL